MTKTRWTANAVGTMHPSDPIVVSTRQTWSAWRGKDAGSEAWDALEGVVGVAAIEGAAMAALPAYEQGSFHIAVRDSEIVILHWFGSAKKLAARKARLLDKQDEEFFAGVLDVSDSLVIGDAWTAGWEVAVGAAAKEEKHGPDRVFVVPRMAGRYVVLEGCDEEEAAWLRILPGDPGAYTPRPSPTPSDSPAEIAAKLVHEIVTPRVVAKQLVATSAFERVKRIAELDQLAVLQRKIAELAPSRPAYARWLEILARAAAGDDARADLTALAEEWLTPATSDRSANQDVSKAELIEAFDAVGAPDLVALKERIANAPTPDVFIGDGDFF
jgi:hypothetical protein